MSGLSRRQVLATAALAALPLSVSAPTRRPKRAAKNIIWCVSDGISTGVPTMAHQFRQRAESKDGVCADLLRDSQASHGVMDARSLSTLVTESAAASSAWGSGVHVWNGQINTLPDGTELQAIFPILREGANMKTGLATRASVTHANPAGFAVAESNRDEEASIAAKYLQADVDVMLGGGGKFFSDELRAKYRAKSYTLVEDRSALRSSRAGKVLGLFSSGHMPYEVDRVHQVSLVNKVPSLREMAAKSIQLLDGTPEGFILQLEGARVDHAAHANDFAGLIYDQLAFEDALEHVLEWARQDGETLVVVTSDHGNANPGLIGAGMEYYEATAGLMSLQSMKMSYERLLPLLKDAQEGSARDLIAEALGVRLKDEEWSLVKQAQAGSHTLKPIEQYQLGSSALSLALSNKTHICWSCRQHSSDVTLVTAIGPGREAFEGLVENIHVFGKLLAHRDLRIEQPTMSYEDGLRIRTGRSEVVGGCTALYRIPRRSAIT